MKSGEEKGKKTKEIFITKWGEEEEGRQQDSKREEGGGRGLGDCEGGL